jgi:hypothetical protein
MHIPLLLWALLALAPQQPGADSAQIPDFDISLVDGAHFKKSDLKAHTPVMIVYYSPTCEHCQHFGQTLADHIGRFKNAQIVMVTFRPVNEVADFTRICHLNGTPAIIGTEGLTFLVQHHYAVQRFPFVATYDKHGHLSGIFRDPPAMDTLVQSLFGKGSPGEVK